MAIQLSQNTSSGKRNLGYKPGSLAEINITPLVDVMLVLLIIFMITAPLMSEGIDINLPNAKAQSIQTANDDIILSIEKNGSLFLQGDKKSLSLEQMQIRLKDLYKDKTKKEIFLRADTSVSYGRVIEIMSLCKNLGIERIGMVTEPSS